MKLSILTMLLLGLLFLEGSKIYAQNTDRPIEVLTAKSMQVQDIAPLPVVIVEPNKEIIGIADLKPPTYTLINYTNTAFVAGNGGMLDNVGVSSESGESTNLERLDEKEIQVVCEEISAYPNPAKTFTNLVLPNRGTYEVYMYDMAGNKKAEWTVKDDSKARLEFLGLTTGNYFLQVICGSEIKTIRIQVVN